MNPMLKRKFFVAIVESILLYGCEAWTLTKTMEKALDTDKHHTLWRPPKTQ